MPTGGGIGMRTVWINLRAMNYTDQAFRSSIANMKKLTDTEKEEYAVMVKNRDQARYTLQTNMLYAASLAMIGQKLFGLINTTQVGATYMTEFNKSLTDMKSAFGDTLFQVLKPVLDILKSFMDLIKNNSAIRTVAVVVALLAVSLGALYLAYKSINAIIALNAARHKLEIWVKAKGLLINNALTGSNTVLGMSYKALGVSIGIAFASFMIFYTILNNLSGPIKIAASAIMILVGAILALVFAKSMLSGTFGLKGVAGLIGVGAMLAGTASLASGMGSYAVGTRMVNHTGPSILHRGEMVYNPSVNRPAGIQKDVMGTPSRNGGNSIVVNFSGDINTKANIDDLDNEFGRKIYRIVKGAS